MKNKFIVLEIFYERLSTIKLNKTKSYLITRQVITVLRTKEKHGLVREGHVLDIDFSFAWSRHESTRENISFTR